MVVWAPLERYLRNDGRERIELSYAEIERILGGPLPASATAHRPVFWSNSRSGGYSRHWRSAGYRTALPGMPHDAVAFERDDAVDAPQPAPADGRRSGYVLLVGCVKSKAAQARPARDLYTSDLFAERRNFAAASGLPWVVLSAEYGAVDPDEVIEPYDRFLEDEPADYHREWGRRVIAQLDARYGPLDGKVFELHASPVYGNPLEPLLHARGATLLRPLDGLRFGEHLHWYTAAPAADASEAAAPAANPGIRMVGAEGLARRITRAFVHGELDLSDRPGAPVAGWAGMPEVRAAQRLRDLGASDAELRVFLTLISAMDRGREPDQLWDRGADAFAAAPGLFDPWDVVRHTFTELLDELRTTGVSQRHAADATAWRIICESLDDIAVAPAIATVLIDGRGDARELLTAVQATTPQGSDRFPLLRGPTIRARWIRMLANPGGARIDNLDALPVAVDAPVRKVSENLGVTATAGQPLEDARDVIQAAWDRDIDVQGSDAPPPLAGTAAALDPAVRFFGTWGCGFCDDAGRARPIHEICGACRLAR